MKTIKNSDIRFEINSRIVYVPSFEMKFYTVNPKEFFFKKTDEDVEAVEESGETKYYIDLDWSQLKYIGKGVMNYKCINNIDDPSFPDGEYNQLIEKTTDYFIDTFTVEPEGDESIAELLEKEEEERKEADAVISGAVDTEIERATSAETALQEAIDAETSARTSADEALSQAIVDEASARTDADATLQTAIDNEASARTSADETLNNAITAETSARTSADEALSGAVDTKLQDYYLKSETSGKTEIQTALDGKSDTGHTHDERYYRKDETSGATELEAALDRKLDASAYTPTDLSNYYTKDETSGKSEIAQAISDEATARANADTALSGAVDTALLGYVNNAAYVSTAKTINLLNGNTVIASIDATDFIKDGMVDNVVISGGSLVITFNTDSGKEAITIALTDIFDPANYYTKTDIDGIVSGKADTTAVTEAITEATSGKANSSDVYLKTETSGKTEIATALSAKLDVTAYTPTDLSNYYTKSETSGATELNTAFSGKQDTLIAGDNITISGNVISAAGGDLSNYYTKSEVDEMSEVAAQGINDLNTNKLDVTAYTPTDLTNYYTKSETSGKTEIQTALGTKQDTLVSGTNIKTVNNESLLGSGNITIQGGGGNNVVELTQAEYDALTTKDPDTFYVITDATPADLSQYWTSAQTQSAITQSVSGKQDTLSAGTGIDITSNVISVTGGGSSVTVVQTTGTSTGDVMSQDAVTTALSGKQNTLSAGTGIDITSNVISVTGSTGGKAVSGGTNISITTGETVDTINCTLSGGTLINISNNKINCSAPIRYGTGNGGIIVGIHTSTNKASGTGSIANGGDANTASGQYSCAEGFSTQATKNSSHSEGFFTIASGNYSHVEGNHTNATNESEHASGRYNVSSTASTTFGDSGNTLFSVGNGTDGNNRHNAFEIRQNGDIYITSGGTDIKLQDNLGGGGSSINVVQTTGTSTTDVMSQDAVTTALSGKQGTLTTGHLVDITNGTISVDLPISAGTSGNYSMLIGAPDINSVASGDCAIASGYFNRAYGDYARADGQGNEAVGNYSYALGCYNSTANEAEFSIGKYNNGRVIYDGEGIVDYTVFTVGNGTSTSARHNAFEVRNSGDIYITSGNSDIKLQDYLGGVNSSTVQTMIDNSISGKADTTAVTTTLGNYYTKSQTSGASEISQALTAKVDYSDVYLKSETSGATEITVALINKADTSAVTAHTSDSTIHVTSANKTSWDGAATNASTAITNLGGLKLQQVTQAEYDAITNKDASTLYVIVS